MVIENMILRRIFGPKRNENREWRRLHNEELHSLYRSPIMVRVIKSRRLRWAGHVAIMEEYRSASGEGFATSHRSTCGDLLSPNDIGKIAQHVREEVGRKRMKMLNILFKLDTYFLSA